MEERKLNFERNEDPTIVEDPEGKIATKLNDIYQKLHLNLGFCHEQLVAGNLTKGMMDMHLSLSEHYVSDFLTAMGYDGILKKESDKRHSEIRSLNDQNRLLRKQLGEKVTNEDFRERAKNITKNIREWWNIYGFGYTSEVHFTEYGYIKVVFSGNVTEQYYGTTDGRDTMENKISYLKELGFEFLESEQSIAINDKNIGTLTKLIIKKYPSARIEEITLLPSSRSKRTYKDITVYIHNLDDIK
jgi:hypothetical protein